MISKSSILDPEGRYNNPLTNKPYTSQYRELAKFWTKLPTYQMANEIISSIKNYQLTFIVSGTGSGKTVLLPRIGLHYTDYKGKVAVVLPKRDITSATADFGAKTMDVQLGQDIGYIHKKSPSQMISSESKLVYMTDGVLISKFVSDTCLSEFNLVIIDEAHERKIQIDLILLFLKKVLQSKKRKDLRVVIMSATIDTTVYQKYFDPINSHVIHVSGQPNYPIQSYFLKNKVDSYLEYGLKIINDIIKQGDKGDILFFVPTVAETKILCKKIKEKYREIYCAEVYAGIHKDKFEIAKSRDLYVSMGYQRKIVIATNVAESSLTIDGLKHVIDSGYELYQYFVPEYYGNVYERRIISKDRALQRKGRVGRTEPGNCYHLFTIEQFENLKDFSEPYILKEDIGIDFLKISYIQESKSINDGLKWLNDLMDPPRSIQVEAAQKIFQIYEIVDNNGKLNKIASKIVEFNTLPINQILFLIYSYQLHCAKQASIIICMINYAKGVLENLFDKKLVNPDVNPYHNLKKMVHKSGDHITFLRIFESYEKSKDKNKWCNKYLFQKNLFTNIEKDARYYYHKILQISKEDSTSRSSNINILENLKKCLTNSHLHLTNRGGKTLSSVEKLNAKITKGSVLSIYRTQKNKSKLIYNELVSIRNKWNYNTVTII